MARQRTGKDIYSRGGYWLDWDTRADGSRRTPFLTIFWYDGARGRTRSASTGSAQLEDAKRALDARYMSDTGGIPTCPTCARPFDLSGGVLVTTAIANYSMLVAVNRPSAGAIRARLAHIIGFIATLPSADVLCEAVDENWIARFRAWNAAQPITSPRGRIRTRTPGTIEASVRQLAAAIAHAAQPVKFRAKPTGEVNFTPQHRSSIDELMAMFRYATDPAHGAARENLHRFLIAAVATAARPDAIYDISTDRKRAQWSSNARVLALNPKGRAQTHKYRATLIVPERFARALEQTTGWWLPIKSVKKSWGGMADALGLPASGEAGTKLIRRSMALLIRRRRVPAEEVELQLGHRKLDSTSDLYAPFEPGYLEHALAAIDSIMDDIESSIPNAFIPHSHRTYTGDAQNIVPIQTAKRTANAKA